MSPSKGLLVYMLHARSTKTLYTFFSRKCERHVK